MNVILSLWHEYSSLGKMGEKQWKEMGLRKKRLLCQRLLWSCWHSLLQLAILSGLYTPAIAEVVTYWVAGSYLQVLSLLT